MRHRILFFLITAAVFLLSAKLLAGEKITVKKVYNGNNIKLEDGTKLKYIGVDSPTKKRLPFYKICKEANRQLVNKKEIAIKLDMLEKNKRGKMLAYVYVGDMFVNAELIKRGFALACNIPPNERYKDKFISLQKEARENKRGLWNFEDISTEPYYVGSMLRKEFHRPECFHAMHLEFEDRLILRTKKEALRMGYRQDWRCCPLFVKTDKKTIDDFVKNQLYGSDG